MKLPITTAFLAILVACTGWLVPVPAAAQERETGEEPAPKARDREKKEENGAKPKPARADVKYGPHERHVLDFWKARADKPTPVVVFIHGGGFKSGDKSKVSPALLNRCLENGISVASISYRLSQIAPFPAPMQDGARAVQFLRLKAKEWEIDPKRFACTGGSAGAGISLWIAFHDDMANPKSGDPVEWQSTRLTCVAVTAAQTSYDPRFIKDLIGGRAHEHRALPQLFGLQPGEFIAERAFKLYEESAPINYVTADDPPAFLYYTEPKGLLPADAKPGEGIHHPKFGEALKAKLDPLKIECIVKHKDDYKGAAGETMHDEMVAFFSHHFATPLPGEERKALFD